MRRALLSIVLAGALAGACTQTDSKETAAPQKAAGDFYALYIKLKLNEKGVPDAKTLSRLTPVLSSDLQVKLGAADNAERRYIKKTKNEAPPLVEGDLFSSLFEGATSYAIGDCLETDKASECDAMLTYKDPANPPTMWTDKVRLKLEGDDWKVDDIAYGGNWDFAPKGTLKARLDDVVKDAAN